MKNKGHLNPAVLNPLALSNLQSAIYGRRLFRL
jgi:hypothetical protein